MKIASFILFAVLLVCGCVDVGDKTKVDKSKDVVKPPVLVEQAEVNSEEAIDTAAKNAVMEQVKLPIKMPPADAMVISSKPGERGIEEDSWGFSVYDPQSGIVEYYSSNGALLGKR